MPWDIRHNPRLLTTILLALAVLIAIILATGGSSFFGNGAPSIGATPTVPPERVTGIVSAQVRHLSGHLWQFTYTVHNQGRTPIAGFQLNGMRANLFALIGPHSWSVFGNGVCGGKYPHLLVYWSTASQSPSVLHAGSTTQFGYRVNTTGTQQISYSLSWSHLPASFGSVPGPVHSSLPASRPCRR